MFTGLVRTARLLADRPFSRGRINNVFPFGWAWEGHPRLLCAQELSDFR
jgi:hypothetical protein